MANKTIRGITIEIGGDTTKLGKALEGVNTKTKSLQTELKGVNALLKLDPTNTDLLTQKQKLLTDAVRNTKEKLDTLKTAQQQVQEQFEKGEVTEEQYRDLQREIVSTETKLKNLTKELENFGSVGAQQIAAVGEKVQNVGGKIESAGKKVSGVSAVAAGGLVAVAKEAVDFETAWTGVTKTVDGTPDQLEAIRQGLLDMSQETASSAEDIAAVAEAAGQLGIKTENILDFTKTMVMLGDTTNLSADEAASALAKFANITGMSADDYGKLGATIVDLGNNFATTESDIVAMATRLASTGEITGLSEPQIMALSAALSSAGIEAEAGGSAMAKLLKQLYSTNAGFDTAQKVIDSTGYSLRDLQLMQSNNSAGFKDLADELGLTKTELSGYIENVDQMNSYASAAGLSIEDFRKAYAEDAVGALSMFIGGLNDTERNGKSAVEILNEMGLTEVRLSNAVLSMASSGDLMTNAITTANNAWGENTALTNEAEKRYGTTASKITQLKNTLSELAVKLGDMLLPIIQKIVGSLSGFVNWLTELNPVAQKVILVVMGLVAALAPALIVIGKVVSAVGKIMTFAPQLVAMFGKIKTAFSGLMGLISAHPVIAIITGVIAAVILLYNKCEWFRNAVNAVLEWLKNAFLAAWETVKNFFVSLWAKIQEIWGAIMQSLQPLIDAVTGAFKEAWELIKVVWDLVKPYFSAIWEGIKGVFMVVKGVLTMYFKNAWEGIKLVWSVVVSYFKTIWANIKEVFSVVKTFFAGMFRTAWEAIKAVWNGVIGYFAAIWNTIKGIFSVVKNVLSGNFKGAWEAIKGIVKTWGSYFSGVWGSIKKVFSSVGSWFGNTFRAAWNAVKNVFSNWGSFFSGLWSKIKNTFSNIGSNIASAISGSVKSGLNGVISAIEGTINWGIGLINGAIGLINKIPGVNIGKIGKLNLPRLAKGGIVDSPTVAEIGENGREAIIPLENNTGWLKGIARELNTHLATAPTADNAALLAKLDNIYDRLNRLQVVLDSGTMVGEMIDKIDAGLANKQILNARGV